MKRLSMYVLVLLLLAGCRSTPFGGHAIIDWVDFIKWEGIEYDGIYSGVLADESYIGDKIGEVKFKVADNVSNPNYKIRNGDAAFHVKGTEIYAIKDHPYLVAVKDSHEINGYKIYYAREQADFKWHFKDMPHDKVKRIEIYESYTPNGPKKISEINTLEEVYKFMEILNNSVENSSFQPNTANGDPTYYDMIFYTEGPVASKFGMQYDGKTYFWHPWDTSILSEEIGEFLY